jgi:hypothetical protein
MKNISGFKPRKGNKRQFYLVEAADIYFDSMDGNVYKGRHRMSLKDVEQLYADIPFLRSEVGLLIDQLNEEEASKASSTGNSSPPGGAPGQPSHSSNPGVEQSFGEGVKDGADRAQAEAHSRFHPEQSGNSSPQPYAGLMEVIQTLICLGLVVGVGCVSFGMAILFFDQPLMTALQLAGIAMVGDLLLWGALIVLFGHSGE